MQLIHHLHFSQHFVTTCRCRLQHSCHQYVNLDPDPAIPMSRSSAEDCRRFLSCIMLRIMQQGKSSNCLIWIKATNNRSAPAMHVKGMHSEHQRRRILDPARYSYGPAAHPGLRITPCTVQYPRPVICLHYCRSCKRAL